LLLADISLITIIVNLDIEKMAKNTRDNHQTGGRTLMQSILLYTMYLGTQVLGIGMIGICCLWTNKYLGGFSLNTPEQAFNYHPLLMATGMVFINANGILFYRISGCFKYPTQKFLHMCLQLTALVVSLAGAYAAFNFHTVKNIPHYYSLHSWLGGASICMFAMSQFGGFLAFMWPGMPAYRRSILPLHVFGGIISIVLAGGVAIAGLTEKALFSLTKEGQEYRDLPEPALLINAFGVSIVLFIISVVYLVTRPDYKRVDVPAINKRD